MYPHGRLILAALVFSASLGLFIALAAFALGIPDVSGALGVRPENSPVHFTSFLMVVVAPTMASLSLALALAASYHFWRNRNMRFGRIALTIAAFSYLLVASLFLPRSSILATLSVGTLLTATAIAAAFLWKLSMPRSCRP